MVYCCILRPYLVIKTTMQKIKLNSQAIAISLSFAVATLGGQSIQAQNNLVSLTQAKCINSGIGSFRQTPLDVAIAKAVYTSPFYLGAGSRSAAVTCKIRRDENKPLFQTLRLGFGMRDNNTTSPPVAVNFYVDSNKAETKNIAPGQKELVLLDVSKATNVTIEAVCSNQTRYCDRVYFFDTLLQPLPPVATTPKK